MKITHIAASILLATIILIQGCAKSKPAPYIISPETERIISEIGISKDQFQVIDENRLYQLSPRQTDQFLRYLHRTEPDLQNRIAMIAEKNIGQPYELHLLGEAPFEPYDAQPLFELSKSDCVVFAEHTYAMSLSDNWADFFTTLQHIRYMEGEVGVVTRNHYTEYDWNRNNSWLVEDITAELGGEDAATYKQTVNKERFFAQRYRLDVPIEKVRIEETYIPFEKVPEIASKLQTGDYVNFIRSPGKNKGSWAGHVGIVRVDEDGTVNIIHSTRPTVRKENILDMVDNYRESTPLRQAEGKAGTVGFKFLRLKKDPITNLANHFGGSIPAITMKPTKYSYLTDDQVKEKLENMKTQDKKKKEQNQQSVDQQVTSATE